MDSSRRMCSIIRKRKENKCVIIIFIVLMVFVAFHWYTYNHRENGDRINDSRVNISAGENNSIYQEGYKTEDKLNLNTASVDELASLMYIGKDEAQKIVDYREKYGEFKSIEDIYNVSGLTSRIRKVILDYTYI